MHIRIVSKPFSFSQKKKIFLNRENLYQAETESIAGENSIKLIDIKSGFVKALIVQKITFMQDHFTIRFLNEENIPINFIRSEKWKHNYEGIYKESKYCLQEIFSKYIILKNGIEIGSWIKSENFSLFEEDNFKILSDSDIELIISLCLIINLKESSKREA